MRKLRSILLLDDNFSTNYIHKKFIDQAECAEHKVDFQSGLDALEYLRAEENPFPELIFIDINMPIMDAWDFLSGYKNIERAQGQKTTIILLSTSLSPKDKEKADRYGIINDIWIKPLSVTSIKTIVQKYFPENS